MKAVSRRTGLSSHVLRIWEKRYGAVRPERTDTNRRRYSEKEVVRLECLALLTQAGHRISEIASLPLGQLEEMRAAEWAWTPAVPPAAPGLAGTGAPVWIEAGMTAVRDSDPAKLEAVFDAAGIALGYSGLLEQVVVPLIQRAGEEWQEGRITVAQEHAASSMIRDYLARSVRAFSPSGFAPQLLVATPLGQIHELGAVISAALARKMGWNVNYLGACLPATDIAGAAIKAKARAVALSIVYPPDDPGLPSQLAELRRLLPDGTELIVGGLAAPGYAETLREIGARTLGDFREFKGELENLRKISQ